MDHKEHLQTLTEIRSLMERSSRFISLSGLSGVFAGIYALAGAYAFYHYYGIGLFADRYWIRAGGETRGMTIDSFIFIDALIVLALSLATGCLLTIRNSRKKGVTIWDATAKRLLINLMVPLAAGGLFCLALMYHGELAFVAPATLIFYGVALINGSKYTLNDIRYLGMCEIALGLVGSFSLGYGLILWSVGFGLLHIVYGAVMYYKYER
jgi:predicted lysophospholipase L1 biosynthesis ABC-type transport system permease subunit